MLDVFAVPDDVVHLTYQHLREKGRTHEEGAVLWLGTFEPPSVTGAIVPLQDTSAGRFTVPLEERQRISRGLAGTGEMVVAQVHSHPSAAFHSSIDDKEAIPRRVGAYSLVIPDFGARDNLLENAALYRLNDAGEWRPAPLDTFRVATLAPSRPTPTTPVRRTALQWLVDTLKSFGPSRT